VRHYSSKPKNKFERPPEWPDLERPPELLPTAAGMNRFPWNLRYESPTELPGAFYAGNGPQGPYALPGTYTLKLTVAGKSQTVPLEIKLDPRVKTSSADLQKLFDLQMKVRDDIEELHVKVNQLRGVRSQLEPIRKRLEEEGEKGKPVIAACDELEKKMTPVEEELIQVKMKSSEGNLRYPNMLDEQYDSFRATLESADAAPTEAELTLFKQLHDRLEKQVAAWKGIAATDVPAVNDLVRKENISLVEVPAGK